MLQNRDPVRTAATKGQLTIENSKPMLAGYSRVSVNHTGTAAARTDTANPETLR